MPMASLAAYFLTGATRRGKARGLKHLGPIIEERLKYMNEYGNDWDGKPVCRLFFSLGRFSPEFFTERPSIMVNGGRKRSTVERRAFGGPRAACQLCCHSCERVVILSCLTVTNYFVPDVFQRRS